MGGLEKPWHLSVILVIIGACAFTTVHGQFTLTGFPLAVQGSTHKVTCNYPGASSYMWRFRGGSNNTAEYTFTVDIAKHNGVWQCDAVVNGVTKTEKVNLLAYCNGVYVTSASTTNPSIGNPTDLNCMVISPTGERVQWDFIAPGSGDNGVAAVTESACEYYHNETDNIRFAPSTTCKSSTSNQFFNLHIKKVSTSHEGYWSCYDFGKSGCYSKPVHIAIAKPPKDPPTLTGFDNPILGTIHTLTCNAWQPFVRPLSYNWHKDGVQISSGNESTWRLQPVKKEANGRYNCVVVDKVKNLTVEAENTLTVYYLASWNPAVEQKKVNQVWIGQSVNLTLNIEAYPLPTSIEWSTDGNTTTLLNVTTTKISDNTWILNITSVEKQDYGNYTANVTNAAGSAFFEFQILPASPPEAPTDLKALKLKDTNALAVTFTAGCNGGAPQNFTIEYNVKGEIEMEIEYIDGIKDPVNTKTVTQEITNLLSGTIYQIKVVAINGVGKGQYSNVIEAKTDAAAMPVWQIVVIALAALLLIVIMFLVIFFVARRKYKEVPAEAKGQDWKKRPISSFVPAGVEMIETVDDGVDNPVLVIKEEKELEKIEPVEDIPVTRSFYHDLNKRVQSRSKDNRKSMTSPFVNSGLAPVVEDEYAVVDKRRKTKNQNGQNDRQSKTASSMAYAAVDFAKKKFRKQSNTGDDKADPKQKTPQNVGVDGTLYAEVTIAKNRPPVANKPKASRKPRAREEQTAYAQVDFDRSAPGVKTDDFEMV